MKVSFVATLLLSFFAQSAFSQSWTNRQIVCQTAELLAEEVEVLDEELHAINAPKDLVEVVHHFEETVMEFAEVARIGTFYEAKEEMQHIRDDIRLIRAKFRKYSWVLNNSDVYREWRHVRTGYRQLDHQMFAGSHKALSVSELGDDLGSLEDDMNELISYHNNES